MARPNKIRSAGREAEVRELAAGGMTSRQIAAQLSETGLKVSHQAVARFLREETEDRRSAARSVAASDAQESVPLVTASLRELIELGMERVRPGKDGERCDHRDFARLSQAVTQASRALHQVTVGDDDDTPRETIDRLAEWVWGGASKG